MDLRKIISIYFASISLFMILLFWNFGIEYLAIVPALSWGVFCIFITLKNSSIKAKKDATIIVSYWTRLSFIIIGFCILMIFFVAIYNKEIFVMGYKFSYHEAILILSVVFSSVIVSISMGNIYKEFIKSFLASEKYAKPDKKILYIVTIVISLIVTYSWVIISKKLLVGERIAFYKGDWLFSIIISCAYVSVFFFIVSFFCLRGIARRRNKSASGS